MDTTLLRNRLIEAETARHKLLTGSMRERISRGGTDITYTRADIGKLDRYITDLRADIAKAEGRGIGRRALNIHF